MKKSGICIIVLTFNEEANIAACLDSLQGLTSPVFVVDSYSSDRTLEILTERGITFAQHPFENYARQRDWAQENCPFESDWVLHLDAGERATPELVRWLTTGFDPDGPADGFLFSRRTIFMGRWIRYGGHYPNYHLRLFRKAKGHCEAKNYDQHFVCSGQIQTAPRNVDILDQVSPNLAAFTTGHLRWAIVEATEQLSRHKPAGEVQPRLLGTPIERRRWLKNRIFERTPLLSRAFLYFFYRYFLRLGFLDGAPGLVFHFLQGCWFRFLVDAAVLEIRRRQKRTGQPVEQVVFELYKVSPVSTLNRL